MTPILTLRTDFSAESFAAFGTVIERPPLEGERLMFSDWLGGGGLSPVLHTNAVTAATLPHTVTRLERHPHAAQAFIPLDVTRYLVTVVPSDADGSPLVAAAQSFIVPGTLGVIYGRGVWHAGATVLDKRGSFAVLMWRGASDDDETIDIAPLLLAADGAPEPSSYKDRITA